MLFGFASFLFAVTLFYFSISWFVCYILYCSLICVSYFDLFLLDFIMCYYPVFYSTVVPPVSMVVRSKAYRCYVKPRVIPNAIYMYRDIHVTYITIFN
jgi:hypothetical protein